MSLNKAYVSSTQVASSTHFDETTSHGFNTPLATDVQAALEHLRDHTIYISRTQATTAAGTLTLTSTDVNLQILTGTAVGYSVQLPSATTLTLTAYYQIINTTTQSVAINDGSGSLLFNLIPNAIGNLFLQLNGTTAGTWIRQQIESNTFAGNLTYNVISGTNFSSSANVDTLITGMTVTPSAGTYSIWYNAQNTGTGAGQQLDCTIYNGAAAITDSTRSNLSTSGTHIFQNSTQTSSQFNGTNTCTIKINPNGNNMTVGQRSMLLIRTGP